MLIIFTDSYTPERTDIKLKKYGNQSVKYFINEKFHVGLNTDHIKKADFYLQQGLQKENMPYGLGLFGKGEQSPIFKMGPIRESSDNKVRNDPLFEGFLRLDSTKIIVSRDNYTLRTWLAELGGIFNIIYSIFYIMCFFIGRYIFMNKMLGEMFLIKPNHSGHHDMKSKISGKVLDLTEHHAQES